MNPKHDRVSHLVRVARIRIETTVVEIEGDDSDDEDAERQAIEEAELLPDDVWVMQPFDENAYRPHVQSIISRAEIAELAQHGRRANAELVDASDSIRYQLLKANCDTAEGELVLQPGSWSSNPTCLPPIFAARGSARCKTWD
jgi:hypothetical protein